MSRNIDGSPTRDWCLQYRDCGLIPYWKRYSNIRCQTAGGMAFMPRFSIISGADLSPSTGLGCGWECLFF